MSPAPLYRSIILFVGLFILDSASDALSQPGYAGSHVSPVPGYAGSHRKPSVEYVIRDKRGLKKATIKMHRPSGDYQIRDNRGRLQGTIEAHQR